MENNPHQMTAEDGADNIAPVVPVIASEVNMPAKKAASKRRSSRGSQKPQKMVGCLTEAEI